MVLLVTALAIGEFTANYLINKMADYPLEYATNTITGRIRRKHDEKKLREYINDKFNKSLEGSVVSEETGSTLSNEQNRKGICSAVFVNAVDNTEINYEFLVFEAKFRVLKEKITKEISELVNKLRRIIWDDDRLPAILRNDKVQHEIRMQYEEFNGRLERVESDVLQIKEGQTRIEEKLKTFGSGKTTFPECPGPTGGVFEGREKELAYLDSVFKDGSTPHAVVVHGFGGLGKSELCRHFAKRYQNDTGNRCVWATYEGSARDTVRSIRVGGIDDSQYRDDPDALYDLKLKALQGEKGLILILDNYGDDPADFNSGGLDSLNRIITTRSEDIPCADSLKVDALDDDTAFRIVDLSVSTNRRFVEQNEDKIREYIDKVNRHTLSVVLLAGLIEHSGLRPDDLGRNLLDISRRTVPSTKDGGSKDTYRGHIEALFDLGGLSDTEVQALVLLTVLPPRGMELDRFCSLSDLDRDEFEDTCWGLCNKGWVQIAYNNTEICDFVSLHPLISEVVTNKKRTSIANGECYTKLIGNMIYWLGGLNSSKDRSFFDHSYLLGGLSEKLLRIPYDVATLEQLSQMTEAASLCADALDYKRSVELCRQSEKILSSDHNYSEEQLLPAFVHLGNACGKLGDHAKELEYKLKALVIREKVLPPEHPNLATSYNNVGYAYGELGDHAKELEYSLKALGIWEKVLPPEHPDLATSYNNVGYAYGELGDHAKGLEYSLKALGIREKVLPPEHPNLATSYNNVGYAYGELGDHAKELEYKLKALEIYEKIIPPDNRDLAWYYRNISGIYGDMQDYEKELEYALKSHMILVNILPSDDLDLSLDYNNLGYAYGDAGEYVKGLEYTLRSKEIREKILPADDQRLAATYNNLAWFYGKLDNYESVLLYAEKAIAIYDPSEDASQIKKNYIRMAEAAAALGETEKAEEYRRRADKTE